MMFITADQILAHLVGDYILQSHWMATEKTKNIWAAAIHAAVYTLPFLLLTTDWLAIQFIYWTHLAVDHYRLARYVIWFKNGYAFRGDEVTATGYRDDVPAWLSVWLLIVADNTLHIILNGIALKWLAS